MLPTYTGHTGYQSHWKVQVILLLVRLLQTFLILAIGQRSTVFFQQSCPLQAAADWPDV